MTKSIRIRLTVFFIGAAIVPIILVGIALVWQSFNRQQAQALALQDETAQRTAIQVERFVIGLERELQVAIRVQNLLDLTYEQQLVVLSKLQANQDGFANLVLLNDTGQEVAFFDPQLVTTQANLGSRAAAEEFLVPYESGETYYGPVLFDELTNEPYLILAVPIVNVVTGQIDGVMVARLRLKEIWDLIALVDVGETGLAYIVDAQGRVVAHPDSAMVLAGISFTLPPDDGIQTGLTADNVALTKAQINFGNQSLYVVTEMPLSEALAPTIATIIIILTLLMVALIIAITLGFFAVRYIVQPIERMAATAYSITEGDLSQQVAVTSDDELGALATAFNTMIDRLREMLRSEQGERIYLQQTIDRYVAHMEQVAEGNLAHRLSIDGNERSAEDPLLVLGYQLNETTNSLHSMIVQTQEVTGDIAAAASEILSAATQQAAGANQQSSAISQTSSTIVEVKTTAQQAFDKAESVAQNAQYTTEISKTGRQAVDETIASMNEIKNRVAGIAENILALSEQTQQIGEITATVNQIATQSNLLALNASVEAARAGEHGKGFAVVAVEVRNLAEQSKQATAQVKSILNEIQQATNAAVMATEEGIKGVDEGVDLTEQTGQTILQLAESITDNAHMAAQIVASAQQQSHGMEQISLAIQNIDQATRQSISSTKQTEQSARDLTDVAQQLEMMISRYKLS